jgi:hypothetical protein
MITGANDKQAPPDEIKFVYKQIDTDVAEKRYEIFSQSPDTPGTHDYGHLDINYGRDARDEVYPVIYDWLKERTEGA